MATPGGELTEAIVATWDAAGIDSEFTNLWKNGADSEFPVLHDREASPGQPFPYCVFRQDERFRKDRMSGGSPGNLNEISETPYDFRIHARTIIAGDNRTAKKIANDLAEHIMKIFGGHKEVAPQPINLDGLLEFRYDSDVGVRTGDDEYLWIVSYEALVDTCVKR